VCSFTHLPFKTILLTLQDTSRDDEGNVLRNISLSQTVLVLYQNYIAFEPRLNFYGETTLTVVAWDRTGTAFNKLCVFLFFAFLRDGLQKLHALSSLKHTRLVLCQKFELYNLRPSHPNAKFVIKR